MAEKITENTKLRIGDIVRHELNGDPIYYKVIQITPLGDYLLDITNLVGASTFSKEIIQDGSWTVLTKWD